MGLAGGVMTLAVLLPLLAPFSAHAGTYTWDGAGANANWSTAANWSGVAPVSDLTNTLIVLDGVTRLTNTLDYALSVNTLTYNSTAGSFSTSGTSTLTIGSGGIADNTTNAVSFTAPIALGAAQTWTAVSGASLTVGAINTAGNALTAANIGDIIVGGVISGSGSVTMNGSGTLTLSGANTFTGGVTLGGNLVLLNSSGALGTTGSISFTGGGLEYSTSNTTDYSSRFSATNSGAITIATNGQNATLAANLGSGDTGGFHKRTSGILTLTGTNTYTGDTIITGGTLTLGSASSLPSTTAVSISGGAGTLNLNGHSAAITGLTSTVTTTFVTLGNATLTDNQNSDSTYLGVITGTGGLTKGGTGALTLTGASTYSGATQITGGTVVGQGGTIGGTSVTSGALGTGNVMVASGATLAVGQAANTAVGTAVSSYQTLAISSLTLTGNSVTGSTVPLLTFDIGPTSGTSDVLQLSGSANSITFSSSGSYFIGIASGSGSAITGPQTYELMTFATPISTASATISNPNSVFTARPTGNLASVNGGSFSWAMSGGNITGLNFSLTGASAVPEPSGGWLALVGAAPLLVARMRRRRRSAA